MIKEVGNSLMDGRELANITLPIQLFEPKSFLQKLTEGFAYAPTYLTRAARILLGLCSSLDLFYLFRLTISHHGPARAL
jgi:hypothetical protein